MIPPGRPPPLYHTPSLLPSIITTLFDSQPVQKPLQVWFFLAWLVSDMPGKGKERKWVDQSLSVPPEQAWEKPAQCFLTRPKLVREHGPSGLNKFSMWLFNWNCQSCFEGRDHWYSHFLQNNREKGLLVAIVRHLKILMLRLTTKVTLSWPLPPRKKAYKTNWWCWV